MVKAIADGSLRTAFENVILKHRVLRLLPNRKHFSTAIYMLSKYRLVMSEICVPVQVDRRQKRQWPWLFAQAT